MPAVYSAIIENGSTSDYWDGDIAWAYDATSDKHSPTAHPNQSARDAQYSTRVYSSCATWESDRDGNAQAGDDEFGMIQAPWDNDDTNGFNIQGWSTGTITLRAIGASRHAGIWDDGAASPHRLVVSDPNSLIQVVESNVTLDGSQIHNTVISDGNNRNIQCTAAYTGLVFSNLIINTADTGGRGIELINVAITAQIWNCVIYCPHTQGTASRGIFNSDASTLDIFNCTIYNFFRGIEIDSGTNVVKNNIIFENLEDINDTASSTIEYNATDDVISGTGNINPSDWSAEMTNYATYDFTLDGGAECAEAGVDSPNSYTDDITGFTRTSTWDIGAFEKAVGVTYVSVSDSGSGVEVVTVAVGLTVTDSGTGVDIVSNILAQITATDTGSGADIVSVLGKILSADTGSGVDVLTVLGKVLIDDTGSGVDIIAAILVFLTILDSGSGVDVVTNLGKVNISDSGTGVDVIANILAQIVIADTGAGADIVSSVLGKVSVLDSGTGADVLSLFIQLLLADTGSGVDTVSVDVGATPKSVSDSGSGTDIISNILAKVTVTDSGVGADILSLFIQILLTDAGSGVDAVSVDTGAISISVSDSGSGVDIIASILAQIAVADSGVGVDIVSSIFAQLLIADSGSGVDAVSIMNALAVLDSGTGVDSISEIKVAVNIQDVGVGVDVIALFNMLTVLDTALGIDLISVLHEKVFASDSATGAELISIFSTLATGVRPWVIGAADITSSEIGKAKQIDDSVIEAAKEIETPNIVKTDPSRIRDI